MTIILLLLLFSIIFVVKLDNIKKIVIMDKSWVSPKIIIGSPATGSHYFDRPEIIEEIWNELDKGNYILIAAPRRVGKTSIMKHMVENPRYLYNLKFENIQGIKTESEFYKRLYGLILNILSGKDKAKKWLSGYLKTKSITEIDIKGSIKIEHNKLDYLNELNQLIVMLEKYDDTIVLLLDELPEVLFNLHKSGRTEEAISILQNLRHWRQDDKYKYLKFVLSGSVGIHYVVQTIEGRNSDLNDLCKIKYEPLSSDEAKAYINWATSEATVKYNVAITEYLLEKITYCVPYFINLMLNEINNRARKNNNIHISNADIDLAFESIVKNNDYFKDWKLRLSKYLPANDFQFCNQLLTHIAHKDEIVVQKIYDIAVTHSKQEDYMDFVDELINDGYITEVQGKYVFISPFLKAFWKKNNPVYNG